MERLPHQWKHASSSKRSSTLSMMPWSSSMPHSAESMCCTSALMLENALEQSCSDGHLYSRGACRGDARCCASPARVVKR